MADRAILDPAGLQSLIEALHTGGYRVLGPTPGIGAIVTGEIGSIDDLPAGLGDEQAAGRYRTRSRGDDLLFGFAATPQAAKPVLFPPDSLLWRGRREDAAFAVDDPIEGEPDPIALLGVRGCDLAAIGIHDEVLAGRATADADYARRRAAVFLVAVTCGSPAGTCFCASMGTGPKPGAGADLTLTELTDPHRFLVEVGTPAGQEVLDQLPARAAATTDLTAADAVVSAATAAMGRAMRVDDVHDLLYASAESPHWADVGARCLACTNCTSVCPTCFCTSIEDVSDLTGDLDERHRVWDSCFSWEYSRLHGGAVRTSTGARYRQWLTHKLAAWTDQFGMSGCVGCGRCITWCPAGIDLTAEVATLRELAAAQGAAAQGAGAHVAVAVAVAPGGAEEE